MATLKSTRFHVHICNLIISLLCVLSIAAYFIMPLWKVDIKLQLTAETLEEILPSEETNEETTDGENGDENSDEALDESDHFELDLDKVLGEDGVDLQLSLTLKTADVLASLSSDATKTVETVLGGLINDMVDQIIEPMNEVAKKVARSASQQVLHEEIRNYIKNGYGGKSEEEVEGILNNAGVTDDYKDKKVDGIIVSLYEDGACGGSVSHEVIGAIDEALLKVHQSDPDTFKKTNLSSDERAKVQENVEEALSMLTKDDGTIDVNNLIADMVLEALGTSSSDQTTDEQNGSDETASANTIFPLSTSTETSGNSIEEVKAELQRLLMENLDKHTKTIADALKYVSYVLLFTFFTWAYLIIKILCKLGKKNNAIKLKLPIWLGTLPALILWLIPTIAISAVKDLLTGTENAGILANLNLTFTSGSCVSFFVAVFLIFFSLFYYGRLRKRLRRYKKGLISDDKNSDKVKKAKKNPYRNDLEFVSGTDTDDVCVGD